MCNGDCVEDEFYFALICPDQSVLRDKFFCETNSFIHVVNFDCLKGGSFSVFNEVK